MNFKQAIEEMKKGKKVRRKGWKDVWLIIDNNGNLLCCSPNFYNKEQIDTKIDDLSLTNVENILADDWEVVEEKKWGPKKGAVYWFITPDGCIDYYSYEDDETDKNFIAIGNCFQTEKQAEFMVEKLKVIHELEKFAYENNEEEAVMVFTHLLKAKYFFRMEIKSKKIQVVSSPTQEYLPFNIYFDSEEIAKKAIETIGEDRIKKYYFGVEEDGRK